MSRVRTFGDRPRERPFFQGFVSRIAQLLHRRAGINRGGLFSKRQFCHLSWQERFGGEVMGEKSVCAILENGSAKMKSGTATFRFGTVTLLGRN